ncbi:MAG: hypothetical protein M9944_12095 [Rhizobiaceae bacterium]|nr:hypothetical protein [Rhizobiaceae bacterium]
MKKHPLLISLLMLLAIVAGQSGRIVRLADVDHFAADVSLQSASEFGAAVVALDEKADFGVWVPPVDEGEDGLPALMASERERDFPLPAWNGRDARVRKLFAPGYWATAPPKET